MKSSSCITEVDLLVTEKLIAKSYYQLKHAVLQPPVSAIETVGQTVQEHPFAAAGVAIIAGIVVCGLGKLTISNAIVEETHGAPDPVQKNQLSSDIIQCIVLSILPSVVPFIVKYIIKKIMRKAI